MGTILERTIARQVILFRLEYLADIFTKNEERLIASRKTTDGFVAIS